MSNGSIGTSGAEDKKGGAIVVHLQSPLISITPVSIEKGLQLLGCGSGSGMGSGSGVLSHEMLMPQIGAFQRSPQDFIQSTAHLSVRLTQDLSLIFPLLLTAI